MNHLFSLNRLHSLWHTKNKPIITDPESPQSWKIFRENVENLTRRLLSSKEMAWILFTDEPGSFAVAFLSLLYAGKDIHLSGVQPEHNISPEGYPVLSDISKISYVGIVKENLLDNQFMNIERDISKSRIILHTSGSTGKPKMVVKELFQIENELDALLVLWSSSFSDSTIYTTVSHQHFYGVLFSIMLPIISGGSIASNKLHYPESLYSLPDDRVTLISSPAFLKRLSSLEIGLSHRLHKVVVFSSGGFLPPGTAEFCKPFLGSHIYEVYGSTETGGIAWKKSPGEGLWKPFDVITILTEREGLLKIQSPYLANNDPFILEDQIKINQNGHFELCGRMDSIVKIEEKRIALNDLENRILDTGFVTDVAVFTFEERRQYIAAAVELNDNGKIEFAGKKKKDKNLYFRNYLSAFFHPTILPKKWRYPEFMPVNSQGKILRQEVVKLFDNPLSDHPEILSESEILNGWIFEIVFPEYYRYFDGHFPEMKILPAVAQVDWILKKIKEKTGRSVQVDRMPRIKFKNPIFPDQKISVKITLKEEISKVTFEYGIAEPKKIFSSGNIYLKENL